MKNKVAWPSLALLTLVALYTLYWFHMASRIEEGIKDWASDQAREGTKVSWESLSVTGYPYRLVATLKEPEIFVAEGDRRPRWHGQELRVISQAWSFGHVILEFLGTQTLELEERESPVGRPLARQAYEMTGSSMRMSLMLHRGKVRQADAALSDLNVDVSQIGDYRPAKLKDDITHMEIAHMEVHSRVRAAEDETSGAIAHDFVFEARDITSDRETPDGFKEQLSRMALNFTRTSDEMPGLHNGSLKTVRRGLTDKAESLRLHEMSIDWQPVTVNLTGDLKSKEGRQPSGTLDLTLKGHRDLVRALEEEGEMDPMAVIVAGALFGILEIAGEPAEDGALHLPLKVKHGEVSFHFLPLFKLKDLGIEIQ
ncbi:MAG: DUF2125 domain-containing protein [Alphaproteobacteria bacterium]|nr:MAG: DUF2125 domain-containing protein [Alphaproteobacteria bacterium]